MKLATNAFRLGVFVLVALGWTLNAGAAPRVIYGEDNRLDLYEVQNSMLAKLSDSTVALFSASDVVVDQERGEAALKLDQYGSGASLCKTEKFFDQPMGAFCSGFLVGPNLLLTAGHCVRSENACQGTKFVFGYNVREKGVYPSKVPASEVYGCKRLVAREEVGTGADWALIELDRNASGHQPLKVNRTGAISSGTSVVVMGHPVGIPLKISGGAKVRDASRPGYFVANLDTYGGNSGSAVVNEFNGEVEGILVRGETDFSWRGSCRVSKVCADSGCRGEDVTKISSVLANLPEARRQMKQELAGR